MERTAESTAAPRHHMVESLLLYWFSALSTTLSPTFTRWCLFHADFAALVPSHRRRTALRPQARCPHCSRHSALLSISEFQQLCFTKHPLPGAQFHHVFMKTSAKHRLRSPMPPRSFLFAEFLESCSLSSTLPPRPNSQPTLLLEAAYADATTQLPLTEFLLGCIYSNDPLDRSVPSLTHGPAHSASLSQPSDIAIINSLSTTSSSSRRHACTPVSRARLHSAPPPPPGLEDQAPWISPHGILVKAVAVRPLLHTSTSVPSMQPHVCTTQVGTHHAIGADERAGRGPLPKPRALVLSMVKFGQAKPDGLGRIGTADSDLMHHQYRLSVLQWNPGPARRNSTNTIAATCGRLHAVILQEASDHVPDITDQFIAYTGNTDLATLAQQGYL